MKQKKMLSLLLAVAMLFSLLPSALAAAPKETIGISMHSTSSERWTRDAEELKSALEEKGYDVALTLTEGGNQADQIDALLAQNIKVLVVCADDPTAIGPALTKAANQGVKVLAYDRLPTDTKAVDALVTFDSRQVGRMQAKLAISVLTASGALTAKDPAVIDIIGGDRTDPNARWVVEGALEVLAPYIKVGMVADPGKADSLLLDSWTAQAGKARMQALLDAGHKSNAVLCGNDALLTGALEAMDGATGLPNGIYVGQDGTAAMATRIANGPQWLASIFKDSRLLARQAAEVADALAQGTALPQADGTRANGKKDVPAYFSQMEILSILNYRELLLDSGYYTTAELKVDPNAPITRDVLLSTLFLLGDEYVADVEEYARDLKLVGKITEDLTVSMEDEIIRGKSSITIAYYCLQAGLLPMASKPLTFADAEDLPASAVKAMEFCNAYGLFQGVGNNRLDPLRPLTRMEWSILLRRIAGAAGALKRNEPERLYAAAVADAVTVQQDEILPLKTSITKDDPNIIWNEAGDKVLMLTWNNTPEKYPEGTKRTVGADGVWVFSLRELSDWYAENTTPITDLDLRMEQLIGLPPDAGYTTMTALWVSPDRMSRPAYQSDITSATMTTTLTGHPKFQEWFEKHAATTYGEDPYPWTRLGYTYDWANNGTEYGLTEFIIRPNSEVEVAFSDSTQDFFVELERRLQTGGNYTDEMKIPHTVDLAEDGADAVERLGDHPDSPYFVQVDFYNATSTANRTILPKFPTLQQTSEWSCGPVAAMMVMDYFDKLGDWNEQTLADLRSDHSDGHDGTCLDQLIEILDKVGGFELETTYDYADDLESVDLDWLRAQVQAGIPVIIGWNDWGAHWQIVIGYDTMGTEYVGDDVLIVADPYDTTDHNQDGYGVYGAERFIYNFTFYDFFPEDHARDMCFVAVKPAA